MNEIQEISNLMDKEIEAITLAAISDLPSRKIGGKASARVVKRRRRTRAASCGASEAPPHEDGTKLTDTNLVEYASL